MHCMQFTFFLITFMEQIQTTFDIKTLVAMGLKAFLEYTFKTFAWMNNR